LKKHRPGQDMSPDNRFRQKGAPSALGMLKNNLAGFDGSKTQPSGFYNLSQQQTPSPVIARQNTGGYM